MTNTVPPSDRIRRLAEQFEQLPPDARGAFDAILALLLTFSEVPREHHASILAIMRAFVQIPKEQQTILLQMAGEDLRDAAPPADPTPTG